MESIFNISNIAAALCMTAALIILLILSIIDLKTRLLPNKLVGSFAALGIAFHIISAGHILSIGQILIGGMTGFGSLYLIRVVANRIYAQDALGLGDVKLLGAAGLWLGPEGVMIAMSAGAFAAVLHGVGVAMRAALKHKTKPDFVHLQIPAGPGFAVGIVIAAVAIFSDFFRELL